MKRKKIWTKGLLALSLFGVALPTAATATIWGTPTAANCAATVNGLPAAAVGTEGNTVYGNCAPPNIAGMHLNYSAISDTGLAGALAGAYVGAYTGGLGVTSNQGPNSAAVSGGNSAGQREVTNQNDYALDNSGNYEMLLLSFSDAATNVPTTVYLNTLTIAGFSGVDSDLTVLAYGGSGSPPCWVTSTAIFWPAGGTSSGTTPTLRRTRQPP